MKKILRSTAIISALAIMLTGCSDRGNSRVIDIYGGTQSSIQNAAAPLAQDRVQSEVKENAEVAPALAEPPIITADGEETPRDFIPDEAYDADDALRAIVEKALTVEILKEKIAEFNEEYPNYAVSGVEVTYDGEPVTKGLLKNGMSVRLLYDGGGALKCAVIRAPKDCIPDDAPQPHNGAYKDEAFPDIIQPKMEAGSFEDSLRYIMLRAETVEDLERDIAETDTENRVIKIRVSKKPDDGAYIKGGVTVTEGSIEDDMTVSVTYDNDGTGLQYYVGHYIDRYYGQIISTGEFQKVIWDAVNTAETVEEFKRLIAEHDTYERVNSVNVYTDGSMTEEVTEGAFASGMKYCIIYDNCRSNMVGNKD